MPTYVYTDPCYLDILTRNVPIAERDNQRCKACGELMTRKSIVFHGSVWAPTAGGMR